MLTSGIIVFVVFVCLNRAPVALLGEHNEALIGGLFETAMIICGIDDPCERQEILGCRTAATGDTCHCQLTLYTSMFIVSVCKNSTFSLLIYVSCNHDTLVNHIFIVDFTFNSSWQAGSE